MKKGYEDPNNIYNKAREFASSEEGRALIKSALEEAAEDIARLQKEAYIDPKRLEIPMYS